MKTAKRVASILTMAAGVFFIANMMSDIQLGFGVTLLAIGFLAWQ